MRRRASVAGHPPSAEFNKLQLLEPMDTFGEGSSRPGTPARTGTPSSLLRKSGSQILDIGVTAVSLDHPVAPKSRARRASVGGMEMGRGPTMMRRASVGAVELGVGLVGGSRRQSIGGLSHLVPPVDDNKERMERASEMMKQAMKKEDSSLLLAAIGEAKAAHMDKSYINDATQLLQQIEAKETLRYHITNSTDLQALKRAVAIAKVNGAEVHFAQTLWEGEVKLEELEAVESLRCALSMPESGSLQLAVKKAQIVRNPPEHLVALMMEAQTILEKLEAHRALIHVLRGKDPDKFKLQDAVEKATAVGLSCPELDQAIFFLDASSERSLSKPSRASIVAPTKFQEIQEQLIRAINLCESGGLRDAIKRAVTHELEMPELEHAKALLAMIEARRLLDAAVKGKTPNKAKLQEALAAAASSGLPPDQTAHAQQMLDLIDARDNLSAAITSKDPEKLVEAIKTAQWCGVERAKIMKAEGILQTAQSKQENSTNNVASTRRSSTMAMIVESPGDSQPPATTGKRPLLLRRQTVAIG